MEAKDFFGWKGFKVYRINGDTFRVERNTEYCKFPMNMVFTDGNWRNELMSAYENFSVDDTIDELRQRVDVRVRFSIGEMLEDFEHWWVLLHEWADEAQKR